MYLKNDPILETELVLIHVEDKPAFYARVEEIRADVKPKWWRIKFLFLTVPLQLATWILDDEQIRGADFTMGGTPIRIEKVVVPEEPGISEEEVEKETESPPASTKKARVLSFHKK